MERRKRHGGTVASTIAPAENQQHAHLLSKTVGDYQAVGAD
jgi:hypothetical protein